MRLRRMGRYRDPAAEDAEWIELDKPIRAGWEKTFQLRDDVAVRKDAHVFAEILESINHSIRSHRKDFRYRLKAKQYETAEPELRILEKEKWNLPDHFRKHFEEGQFAQTMDDRGRPIEPEYQRKIRGFRFLYPYYCQTTIVPFYATHRKIHRADREARLKELENKIESVGGWKRLFKAYHDCNEGGAWWHGDRAERAEILGRLSYRDGVREYLEIVLPRGD